MWEFFLSCNCQQKLFCFWKIGSKFPETWILTSIFHKAKMSHRLSVKNKETKWNLFFREIDCISRMVPTTWVADYTHSHFVGPLQVSTHFILGQNFFSVIGQTYTCKCTYHMQKKKKNEKKRKQRKKKNTKKEMKWAETWYLKSSYEETSSAIGSVPYLGAIDRPSCFKELQLSRNFFLPI